VVDKQLQEFLSSKLHVRIKDILPVGGGSINRTYKIITSTGSFFCKVNSASKFPHLFTKEKNGLALIGKQNLIKVPGVIDIGCYGDQQVLVLEWIEEGARNQEFWKTFGQQLAALHQITNEEFGWQEDNFMGSVPQSNKPHTSWTSFFIEERIQPMVKLCSGRLTTKHLEQLKVFYQRVPSIFNEQKPTLVHGDLWSGNFMCNNENQPVLIDPGVYFGHPSVDLAMSTLFGGFDKSFYQAYHYHSPFPPNYKEQWQAFNLYPLLIHLYLFGRSYLQQIDQTLAGFA
jgi:fructosamine-3-kinase